MPIVWASKLLGTPLPERVAGVDLFQELVRLNAEKGYRPFFFGARQWVVEKVVDEFQKKYPNLNVAGYRNGYYKENEEREIVEMIRDSQADVETLCDDESGVCLDGDEGVFQEEAERLNILKKFEGKT